MATSGITGVIEPKDVPLEYTVLKDPEQLQTPTVKVIAEEDESRTSRATEFHGKVYSNICLSLLLNYLCNR